MPIAANLTMTNLAGTSESLNSIAPNGDGAVRRVNVASAAGLPEFLTTSKKVLRPTAARPFSVHQITVSYSIPVAATSTAPGFTVNKRDIFDIPVIPGVDMLPYVRKCALAVSQYLRNTAHAGADVTGGKYDVAAITDIILGML